MDNRMPVLDGLETTRQLRQDARFKWLPPILAMTANAQAADRQASLAAGMNDHLTKPIDADLLYSMLLRWLPADPAQRRLAGRRVLVVDDNALNREVASEFLSARLMQVDAATDGLEALARLEQRPDAYDFVLMDIQMPQMDGLTASRQIRQQPRWAKLPIIALTAQAQMSGRKASLAAGMNAHLTKPIDETLLYQTLLQFLPDDVPGGSSSADAIRIGTRSAAQSIAASVSSNAPSADQGASMASNTGRNTVPNAAPFSTPGTITGAQLPETLPGMDLQVALSRIHGKKDRLLRLLHGFMRDFSLVPEQLSDASYLAQSKSLETLAHTVKSAANYLGAAALSQAASELEVAAVSAERTSLPEKAAIFQAQLRRVLEGLQQLFEPTVAALQTNTTLDHDRLLALISAAEPLVARCDYASLALLSEINQRASGTAVAALSEQAHSHFEEIDLPAAGNALRQLREELGRLAGAAGSDD
jgi:CheY-like chemotaxis protein/HPt (histidine-containing phosphotransfer) domain-containing protein